MHERLLLVALLLLLILCLGYFLRITGFSTLTDITISVLEKTAGRITIDYKSALEVGSQQNIYAEFTNIGNTNLNARIEIKIYGYINNTLKPLASYYDSTVPLMSGQRRGFRAVFVPPEATVYYIQARGYYDTKVVETWGVFRAYYKVVEQYRPVYYGIPSGTILVPRRVSMELNYTDRVKLMPGDTVLASILISNTGEVDLNNIRIYLVASSLLSISVNGKQVARLAPNASIIFLLTITAPPNISVGEYPLEFDVISDEAKESGKITVEVLSVAVPEEEDIYNMILNYQYLISEVEREIDAYRNEGYDVSLANESLSIAKQYLKSAKDNYNMRLFDRAKEDLQKTRKYLEDAVFQLANATLYLYAPPAFAPYWLVVILAVAAVLIALLYYRKRKKERRPKILREMVAEETEK